MILGYITESRSGFSANDLRMIEVFLRRRRDGHIKTFAMIRFVILMFLMFLSFCGSSNTIVVCAGCEVKSVQEAIVLANPFDTILIKEGRYQEHEIIIDKPIILIGENFPVIDGEYLGEIIQVQSDSVTIDGLVIKNVNRSFTKDNAAVRLVHSEHFLIQNLILENVYFGIYLQKSNRGTIRFNDIRSSGKTEAGSGNGIHLWHCNNVLIDGNEMQGMRDGIYFEFADSSVIRNNHSHDNIRYGLHFMFSNHDVYHDNTFERNGAGVAVMFSKFIDMHKNVFRENWGPSSYGLLLKEINDAEIFDNVFEKNTIGINVEGTNRITYRRNNFLENGWAIRVRGACYENLYTENNFLYNSFNLSYNSNLNDNKFVKNYWSDYAGYDLDRDGIGDVPYRPVNLFSYIVNRSPETIVLLRSLFMDIIDFSERVSPVFTPDKLIDPSPLMKMVK